MSVVCGLLGGELKIYKAYGKLAHGRIGDQSLWQKRANENMYGWNAKTAGGATTVQA